MLGPPPLPLFIFVRFSMTTSPSPQLTYFLNDPILYFYMKLIINVIFIHVITLASPVYLYFDSQSKTTINCLSSHL